MHCPRCLLREAYPLLFEGGTDFGLRGFVTRAPIILPMPTVTNGIRAAAGGDALCSGRAHVIQRPAQRSRAALPAAAARRGRRVRLQLQRRPGRWRAGLRWWWPRRWALRESRGAAGPPHRSRWAVTVTPTQVQTLLCCVSCCVAPQMSIMQRTCAMAHAGPSVR